MRIDCHNHLNGGGVNWGWDDNARLIEAADKLEIDQLCCSVPIVRGIPTQDEVRACNDAVLEAMGRWRGRILGYCFVCPGVPGTLDEIQRCLDLGMIGIKLYNQYKLWDPLAHPIIERAIEHDVPILMHAGYQAPEYANGQPSISNAADFVRAAREHPEAMFIEAHIGGGGDWEWAIKQLRDAPSVFLDTSGSVVDAGMIDMAHRELGAERLLFGTDMSMEAGVGKVLGAAMPEADRECLFHGNMANILARRR